MRSHFAETSESGGGGGGGASGQVIENGTMSYIPCFMGGGKSFWLTYKKKIANSLALKCNFCGIALTRRHSILHVMQTESLLYAKSSTVTHILYRILVESPQRGRTKNISTQDPVLLLIMKIWEEHLQVGFRVIGGAVQVFMYKVLWDEEISKFVVKLLLL